MSTWKKRTLVVCRVYKGWQITQLYEDYSEPLQGSLSNNQYFMESKRVFAQILLVEISVVAIMQI